MLKYLNVKSSSRSEFIDITAQVQEEITEAGMESGVCYVYVPHTTAGVTINEGADPSVQVDMLSTLSQLVPQDPNYRHAEGNSDAHMKSSMIGASLSVPVHEGKLILGTWQAIFFAEFDGPRHRRVALKFLTDAS
ncbi:MAG TPA: YjbQ family protein [Nitrospirae bacterium]|nr:YjbQ family protein [Nitrospirota bacterium]